MHVSLGPTGASRVALERAVWSDFWAVVLEAGVPLVGQLMRALRDGDQDRAANSARLVAETIAFKRILRKARR